LDVIGVNYYERNQWWNFGSTIWRGEAAYRPFREILAEVYKRYRRPMFISETGTEDDERPEWLAYIASEARAAMRHGVSLHGICLYPILNHPGWDDDRHCHNGLWDYPSLSGEREIYEPLAQELRRQQEHEGESYDPPKSIASNRPNLHFSSPVELCISTATASDEPLCGGKARVLLRGAGY
jgi:hypothetical protein